MTDRGRSGTGRRGSVTTRVIRAVLPYVILAAVVLAPSAVVWRSWLRATAAPMAGAEPSDPERITVGSLGIRDAEILPMALDDGVLHPPDNPRQVGWWNRSADAGADRGVVLLTAHKVSGGNGVFEHLVDIRPGAEVELAGAAGSYLYRVDSVRVITKERLAVESSELFSQSGPHRLVLVTCEDWDGRTFESNSVVVASPVVGTVPA